MVLFDYLSAPTDDRAAEALAGSGLFMLTANGVDPVVQLGRLEALLTGRSYAEVAATAPAVQGASARSTPSRSSARRRVWSDSGSSAVAAYVLLTGDQAPAMAATMASRSSGSPGRTFPAACAATIASSFGWRLDRAKASPAGRRSNRIQLVRRTCSGWRRYSSTAEPTASTAP
jgi:hypothetical protein